MKTAVFMKKNLIMIADLMENRFFSAKSGVFSFWRCLVQHLEQEIMTI